MSSIGISIENFIPSSNKGVFPKKTHDDLFYIGTVARYNINDLLSMGNYRCIYFSDDNHIVGKCLDNEFIFLKTDNSSAFAICHIDSVTFWGLLPKYIQNKIKSSLKKTKDRLVNCTTCKRLTKKSICTKCITCNKIQQCNKCVTKCVVCNGSFCEWTCFERHRCNVDSTNICEYCWARDNATDACSMCYVMLCQSCTMTCSSCQAKTFGACRDVYCMDCIDSEGICSECANWELKSKKLKGKCAYCFRGRPIGECCWCYDKLCYDCIAPCSKCDSDYCVDCWGDYADHCSICRS